jgi:hypothetical protein
MTARTRRQFIAATGVTLAAVLATNPVRAQLAGERSMSRPPFKVGVAPAYIVSERGSIRPILTSCRKASPLTSICLDRK